jgi:hydroxypyruvate isomerase
VNDFTLSASTEVLFADGGRPLADRVRAAAAAGCERIDFWTWRDQPLEHIAAAAAGTGLAAPMMIVGPPGRLVDPARSPEFLEAVRESAAAAARNGCRAPVAMSGNGRPEASAAEQDQAIVDALQAAAPIAGERGVELLLEPPSAARDHAGTYLAQTMLGLALLERVDRPAVGLLDDVYHSVMMGEEPARVLAERAERIGSRPRSRHQRPPRAGHGNDRLGAHHRHALRRRLSRVRRTRVPPDGRQREEYERAP